MTRTELARLIDHTLLKPEATGADVARLCDDAVRLGVYSVCVSPSLVGVAVARLAGSGVLVGTVAGFPSGAHAGAVKQTEASLAVGDGADEVDMVIDLGQARAGAWEAVSEEIAAVRAAVPGVLKVIIEAGALHEAEIVAACRACERAGADFVKTSTGFHPRGGATVQAVRLIAATVGGRLGVKASGGIASAAAALALVDAGATRIGLSRTETVLDGLPA
jgi:deoxyribose-phosphate aldolase